MSTPLPQQMSLGISLDDDATFSNFYCAPGSQNAQLVQALQTQLLPEGESFVYLWGASGVSHLLQAACHAADNLGVSFQYLPLDELATMSPDSLLEGLDELDWLCIDGLQFVVANPDWEMALFALFNGLRDKGGRLLIAANASPNELPIALADLQSRLNWGLTLSIQALSDEEKLAALQLRANGRGLELGDEVGQYILHRAPRDMGPLFQCLNTLDNASLAEQRRLTIPFVKQVLGF